VLAAFRKQLTSRDGSAAQASLFERWSRRGDELGARELTLAEPPSGRPDDDMLEALPLSRKETYRLSRRETLSVR
jgi:hypothetical protein